MADLAVGCWQSPERPLGQFAGRGERRSPADSLTQRAKQPSVGGDVVAFSTASGRQRELPPMWAPRTMRQLGAGLYIGGRFVEEEYGQIL